MNSPALEPTTPEIPTRRAKLSVVLFSGGSGTQTITEAFLKHPQISLTILINAYDDGHSTGRLRRFIPGMLGPSDIRKNINRLMPQSEQRHRALRFISDYRLPLAWSSPAAWIWCGASRTRIGERYPPIWLRDSSSFP
jgi:hypothetical protein